MTPLFQRIDSLQRRFAQRLILDAGKLCAQKFFRVPRQREIEVPRNQLLTLERVERSENALAVKQICVFKREAIGQCASRSFAIAGSQHDGFGARKLHATAEWRHRGVIHQPNESESSRREPRANSRLRANRGGVGLDAPLLEVHRAVADE